MSMSRCRELVAGPEYIQGNAFDGNAGRSLKKIGGQRLCFFIGCPQRSNFRAILTDDIE